MTLRLSLLIALAACLVACGGDQPHERQRAGSGGKKYGGTYTLNVLRGSPNGLDPVLINSKHADDIASQIYDKLIDLDDALKLVPELARALPSISTDGRTYRFSLRTDVSFHDNKCFPGGKGRRFTAQDVKYSFTRCCDPRTKTIAFWAFQDKVKGATEYQLAIKNGKPTDGVEGFRVIDDSTFEIELVRPYAPFLFYLVNSLGAIVPHEAVEMYGADYFRNPVGTGPFIFESWSQDQEIVLHRNPSYWGSDAQGNRLPLLDRIRFLFITDDKVQFNEFLAGNLDESFNLPTERFDDVFDATTGKAKPEFSQYQMQAVPAMLTWFCDFLTTKPPFDNPDVRRAFNYAIDRDKIVRFVLKGSPYAAATHGVVPPVFAGYPFDSVAGYTYDPARAKALLARAGYPNGQGFPPLTMHIYPEPRLQQVAEAIQEMIGQSLGIRLQLQTIEFPQLTAQSEDGKLALWGTRWYGDYPDPETFLNLFNGTLIPTSDTIPSYPNSTRYKNAAFNAAFLEGVKTIDFAARMKHYLDAERVMIADAPVIPLFYERHYRLLQPWVRDVTLDAMARYDLKYAWIDRDGSSTE
jgi:peptide/nickel transport system substrate-binding protein